MPNEESANPDNPQKFIDWTKLKIRIHLQVEINFYFKEREVWWASLGYNIGHEENGKNEKFERPVLIFKKFNKNMLWAVPLTKRQSNNAYLHQIKYELGIGSVILTQLRLISSKRLIRVMYTIPKVEFEEIKDKIIKLLS